MRLYGLSGARVEVIPNGVPADAFTPTPPEAPARRPGGRWPRRSASTSSPDRPAGGLPRRARARRRIPLLAVDAMAIVADGPAGRGRSRAAGRRAGRRGPRAAVRAGCTWSVRCRAGPVAGRQRRAGRAQPQRGHPGGRDRGRAGRPARGGHVGRRRRRGGRRRRRRAAGRRPSARGAGRGAARRSLDPARGRGDGRGRSRALRRAGSASTGWPTAWEPLLRAGRGYGALMAATEPDRPRASPSMARRSVKHAAELADLVRRPARGIVVLIYHRVGRRSSIEVDLPEALFDEQMAVLAASGRAVTLDAALELLAAPAPPATVAHGRDPVVVTFDDGTRDLAEVAAPDPGPPRLPATLYVATDFVDQARAVPRRRRGRCRGPSCGTCRPAGCGSSGRTPTPTRCSTASTGPRWTTSSTARSSRIGTETGVAPAHFAYPKALGRGQPRPSGRCVVGSARRRWPAPGPTATATPIPWRLARSPVQVSDGMRWFERKLAGGMGLEDALRRVVNRRRYAGADDLSRRTGRADAGRRADQLDHAVLIGVASASSRSAGRGPGRRCAPRPRRRRRRDPRTAAGGAAASRPDGPRCRAPRAAGGGPRGIVPAASGSTSTTVSQLIGSPYVGIGHEGDAGQVARARRGSAA